MGVVMSGPGEGERLPAGPTTTVVKVGGADTGGRLSVVELHLAAGFSGPPPHVHREVEHTWYVLDGEVVLTVDARAATHGPGACLHVPAGVAHTFATQASPAVILQVDSPRTLDDYFRELMIAFPPGSPVDPEVVGEIMGRHDTRPVGN